MRGDRRRTATDGGRRTDAVVPSRRMRRASTDRAAFSAIDTERLGASAWIGDSKPLCYCRPTRRPPRLSLRCLCLPACLPIASTSLLLSLSLSLLLWLQPRSDLCWRWLPRGTGSLGRVEAFLALSPLLLQLHDTHERVSETRMTHKTLGRPRAPSPWSRARSAWRAPGAASPRRSGRSARRAPASSPPAEHVDRSVEVSPYTLTHTARRAARHAPCLWSRG